MDEANDAIRPVVLGAFGDARAAFRAIVEVAERVHEPCALAGGRKWGLVSAGMIGSIALRTSAPGQWHVRVVGRTTSPACLMYLYFEREILRRLEGSPFLCTFAWRFGEGVLRHQNASDLHWSEQEVDGWSVWTLPDPEEPQSATPSFAPLQRFPQFGELGRCVDDAGGLQITQGSP